VQIAFQTLFCKTCLCHFHTLCCSPNITTSIKSSINVEHTENLTVKNTVDEKGNHTQRHKWEEKYEQRILMQCARIMQGYGPVAGMENRHKLDSKYGSHGFLCFSQYCSLDPPHTYVHYNHDFKVYPL